MFWRKAVGVSVLRGCTESDCWSIPTLQFSNTQDHLSLHHENVLIFVNWNWTFGQLNCLHAYFFLVPV